MDSNTFAILILALATVIVCVVIWQIFGVARVRALAAATANQQERASQLDHQQRQLDQRLISLADDVHELGRRIAELELPTHPGTQRHAQPADAPRPSEQRREDPT